MATQITLTQIRTVVDTDPPNGAYKFRLNASVICDSTDTGFITGPPAAAQVFLWQKGATAPEDVFVHTCTLGDYLTYANSRAGNPAQDFYRKATTEDLDYDELDDAVAESDLQKTRLQNLVTDWENYQDENWDAPAPGEDTIITA